METLNLINNFSHIPKKRNDSRHKDSRAFLSQKKETKTFLEALAKKTACKITITLLKYPKDKNNENDRPKGYVLNNKQPIRIEDAFSLLEEENAWHKNAYGYSVLWAFSRENQRFNVVVIDDIQDIETFKLRDHFLLWNTSDKFQAAFLLDKGVTAEEAKQIQRVLIGDYGGDLGGLGASHNKKLPGFYNTKYNPPPFMKIHHIGSTVVDTEATLWLYKEIYGKGAIKYKRRGTEHPILTVEQTLSLDKIQKSWQDFMREKGNRSQADIAYAIYLFGRGYTEEQVRQALLSESEDIETRKKGHLEDYLDRTIIAARRYFEVHHKEKTHDKAKQ